MPGKPSYNPVGYQFDLKIQKLDQGGETYFGGDFSIRDNGDPTRSFALTERSHSAERGIYEHTFAHSTTENWSHFTLYKDDLGQPLYDFHYSSLTVPTKLPLPFNSGGLCYDGYTTNGFNFAYLLGLIGNDSCMFLDTENADYWLEGLTIQKIPDTLANFFTTSTNNSSALLKSDTADSYRYTDVSVYPFNISSDAAQDSSIHKENIHQNTSQYNTHAKKVMMYNQGASPFQLQNRYIKAPIANIVDHEDIELNEENVGVLYMGIGLQNLEVPTAEVFDSIGTWIIYKNHDGNVVRGQISYTDYTSEDSTAISGEEGSGVVTT